MFTDDLQKEKIKKAELSTTARARQKAKEKKAEKAKGEGSAGAPAHPSAHPLPLFCTPCWQVSVSACANHYT